MSVLSVLGRALTRATGHWPLALALYLPGLAIALASAVPVFLGARALSLLGPWTQRVAEGSSLDLLIESAATSAAGATLNTPAPSEVTVAGTAQLAGGAILLVGVLVNGLAYTLLAGGIVERLCDHAGGSFWTACRRWFWPMLRFGALAVVVVLVLGGVGGSLLVRVPQDRAVSVVALRLGLGACWISLVNGLLELGRAMLVVTSPSPTTLKLAASSGRRRGALAALARAARLVAHPPRLVVALGVWLGLAAAAAAYGAVASALLGAASALVPLATLVVQQLALLVGAWLKLLRLAVAVELARMAPVSADRLEIVV